MEPTTGLRERKKEATRLALHAAALRLVAEHGLEHVTVEAIADAADVSRRTFSNHFTGKEECVVYGDTCRLRDLLQRLRDQPADYGPWEALTRVTLAAIPAIFDEDDPVQRALREATRRDPALAPYRAAAFSTKERELAAVLAQRLHGEDVVLHSRIIATTFLAAVRTAVQHWSANPGSSLVEVVRTALALAAPASQR